MITAALLLAGAIWVIAAGVLFVAAGLALMDGQSRTPVLLAIAAAVSLILSGSCFYVAGAQ